MSTTTPTQETSSGTDVLQAPLSDGSAPAETPPKNGEEPSPDGPLDAGSGANVYGGDPHQEDERISSTRRLSADSSSLTGALQYSYPLTVPPGRKGMQPSLSLNYSSDDTGEMSAFGYGWSVSIPYIERIAKDGVDHLYQRTYFASSLDGELASTTGNYYGPKVENGSFRKYYSATSSDGWIVTDKIGTTYIFGSASSTRQADPNHTGKIYKWMLEKVKDSNGNYITYSYFKDRGQIYPDTITYTNKSGATGIFSVVFSRESRTDVATSTATGFTVVSRYRISEIQAQIGGAWVRKYALAYTTGDNGVRSLLSSITESGKDESGTTITLPAASFHYQSATKTWTLNSSYDIPQAFIDGSNQDQGVRLADTNGDGLVDFLFAKGTGSRTIYTNKGAPSGWIAATSAIPHFFVSDTYQDTGARFEDLNGDHMADFFRGDTNEVYINRGGNAGFAYDPTYTLPELIVDGSYKDRAVRLADVNGDGLVDFTRYGGGSLDYVYINNGHGSWPQDTNYSLPEQFTDGNNVDLGVRFADVNGDGLADLIRGKDSDRKVYINKGNGTGWSLDSHYSLPLPLVDSTGKDEGSRLADVNGDGLVDFLHAKGGGSREVYINKNDGTGWALDSNYSLPHFFTNSDGTDAGARLADVNGDGITDFIRGDSTHEVYLSNGKKTDVLTRITHSEGGKTEVTYKASPLYRLSATASTTLLNAHLPFVLYTVQQKAEYDGLSATTSVVTYEYSGGRFYFNNAFDRRLAGFATTTATNAAGDVTKTYFHQGNTSDAANGEYNDHFSKIGKVYRTESRDNSNNLYAKTVSTWDRYDLSQHRNFVKNATTTSFSYDGDADHADKAESYVYDDTNGNVKRKVEWGRVTGSDTGTPTDTGTDKFTTSYSYVASTTAYMEGIPSQETTTDQSSTKVKETKFYFDNLSLGNVGSGNETKREMWKESSTYINIQHAYNSYGLPTSETDPRGKVTTFTYEPQNLYVATSTNPVSHVTGYVYDYSNGKAKRTINPNGHTFETVFDALDRIKEEKQPDLTTPSTRVTKTLFTYTDSQPRSVQETHYLDGSTSFDIYKYFDGFGRLIQDRRGGESFYAVHDLVYNNHSLLSTESLPYFSSGSSKTTATTTSALFTTYRYDPLDRVSSIANAVGTTTYAYDDWKTTITDPEPNTKDLTRDAYGRLTQVDEHNDASTYTTTYEYNYLGSLTKITDAASNLRNFTYDGLGRRTAAEDLHASGDATFGSWSYTFDDAGNVATSTNPEGKVVGYVYDAINRVIREDYTGKTGTEVTYAYDSCANGTGHLCAATTTAVGTSYMYNPLGSPRQETRTIDGTKYVTKFDHDRALNQTKVTYPDNAEATYTYNTAGLLETVSRKESGGSTISVITDFDYSPSEQITLQAYQNGAETIREYDKAKLYRLMHLKTYFPGGVGGPGMDEEGGYPLVPVEESPLALADDAAPAENTSRTTEEVTTPEPAPGTSPDAATTTETVTLPESSSEADETATTTSPSDQQTGEMVPTETDDAASAATSTVSTSESSSTQPEILAEETPLANEESSSDTSTSTAEVTETALADTTATTPDSLSEEYEKDERIKSEYVLENSALIKEKDEVRITVGDDKGKKFVPKAKFERWDEVFLEVSLPESGTTSTPSLSLAEDKIVWKDADKEVRFYELPDSESLLEGAYEIDAVFSKKPASNVVSFDIETSNLDFFYQPPLDKEAHGSYIDHCTPTQCFDKNGEIVAERPEHIIGSYAVYYKEGKAGDFSQGDGKDYRAGKAFHIYRPKIIDKAGKSVWGELNIDPTQGKLAITIPQEFLDTAEYPVIVDPTFGYTTAGASQESCRDTIASSLFTGAAGTGDKITAYTDHGSTAKKHKMAVYNHSTLALVEDTNELTGVSGAAWRDYTFQTTPTFTNGTEYLLACWADLGATFSRINYDTGVTDQGHADGQTYVSGNGGFPDPAVIDAHNTNKYSIYVTYTAPIQEGNPRRVEVVQDLTYSYDNVGNITQIADASETDSNKTTVFGYDDLYRLTTASTTAATSTQEGYSHTYAYNSLGNITSKSDAGDYAYEGNQGSSYANPHAATAIGGGSGGTPETIAFDATSNDATACTSDGAAPYEMSWSHTVTSVGTNRLLVVGASMSADNDTISSVTYGGQSLTKIREDVNAGAGLTSLWYMVNPPTGSNTVLVTVSSSFTEGCASALSLTGVDQSSPVDAQNGTTVDSADSVSTSVTTVADNAWLVDVVMKRSNSGSLTVGGGQTARQNNDGGFIDYGMSTVDGKTPAGSETMDWTDGGAAGTFNWALSAASFTPAGSGGSATTTYTYTRSGNLLSDGTWNYRWSYRGELTRATTTSLSMLAGYDHAGDRIRIFEDNATTTIPNQFYSKQGSTTTKHIFAGTQLVATVEISPATTTIAYIHTDHLGGTNAATDDYKQLILLADYYPFGSIRFNNQYTDFNERKKFTGHEYDATTQLSYMGARYQSGTQGRFLSQDPVFVDSHEKFLEDPQQMNSYSYSRNNPLKYVDPNGQEAVTAILTSPVWAPVIIGGAIGVYYATLNLAKNFPELRWGGVRQEPNIGWPNPPSIGDTDPPNWNPKVPNWIKWSVIGGTIAELVREVYEPFQETKGLIKDWWSRTRDNQGGAYWQQGGTYYTNPNSNPTQSESSSGYNSQTSQFHQTQFNRYQAVYGTDAATQKVQQDAEDIQSGKVAPIY